MKTFNSSVDIVVLTDHVLKQAVELANRWGKKKGSPLMFRHKERHFKLVRQMQQRFVDALNDKSKVVQYRHSDRDESALFEVGQFLSFKWAELHGFSEPSNPWVEGESWDVQFLRQKEPLTTKELIRSLSYMGQLMKDGVDPIELSKTNQLIMPNGLETSEGGIVLG